MTKINKHEINELKSDLMIYIQELLRHNFDGEPVAYPVFDNIGFVVKFERTAIAESLASTRDKYHQKPSIDCNVSRMLEAIGAANECIKRLHDLDVTVPVPWVANSAASGGTE